MIVPELLPTYIQARIRSRKDNIVFMTFAHVFIGLLLTYELKLLATLAI
jgi:hypothetical protein